ncbi:toll/interleukin-1 receptor domain-containing protein [Vibrio vulnificus]|uniref:toll/interleukin-1 receptor domain-containing protein n=1 Tax=Vibrio vulnificus TaxID=672 RepID=UPI0040589778
MKVFISWSGDLSKELGEALRDWLPAVIQSVKPFFTPNDIEKGARWSKDIANELESSSVGVFCITPDNLTKPWLMFEAGALSKNLEVSKVCPILFGVEPTDLQGPLVQFQASPFEKTEVKKLIKTINSCLGDSKLEDSVLNSVFDMWWPKLQEKVNSILDKHKNTSNGEEKEVRSEREILEEVLELTRLNTARSKQRGISPGAVEHLVDIVEGTIDCIQGKASREETLEHFSEILKPIRHMVTSASLSRNRQTYLNDKIDGLEFEVFGSDPEN